MSPSARKVWIEIVKDGKMLVDAVSSPSARKVWIEITATSFLITARDVTFREEGVD